MPTALQKKIDKYFFWLTYFMAFPGLLLFGQNLSLFILIPLVLTILRYRLLIKLNTLIQFLALFFGVGAILSVINMPVDYSKDATSRAISVLPNFLYWSFLVIFLVTHRDLLRLEVAIKAIYYGVVTTVFYYLFIGGSLLFIPIFKLIAPNAYAFLLICFSPIAIFYLHRKKKTYAILMLIVLVGTLLFDGRRAGVILVLLGGLPVLVSDKINARRVFFIIILIGFGFGIVYTKPVKSLVFSISERIHTLVYDFQSVQKEDRSYLTRVAMVKKGWDIFEMYPYTGIGLNNFSNYYVKINADFEGAKYVVHKRNLNIMSAHNSYIALLSEGGLVLATPFILIIGFCILYFVAKFYYIPMEHKPFFFGLIAMSIHLYFITAIVNVFAWFLIGITSALMYVPYKTLNRKSILLSKKTKLI